MKMMVMVVVCTLVSGVFEGGGVVDGGIRSDCTVGCNGVVDLIVSVCFFWWL